MNRQIQDDALYNDKWEKEEKKSRDNERIIALLLVVGPILIAIVDRVLRELGY